MFFKLCLAIFYSQSRASYTIYEFVRNQTILLLLKVLMLYQYTVLTLGVLLVLPIFIVLKFLPWIWLALVLLLLSPLVLIIYLSLLLLVLSLTNSISFSINLVTASMWTQIAKKNDELYKKAVHKDKYMSALNVKLLNKAIFAYERLSQHPKFAGTTLLTIGDRLDFLDHLAKFHFNRHEVTGQEQDLKRAISLYQVVVVCTPSAFPSKPKYLVSLGLTLQYYYLYLKQRDVHLGEIASLEQAIDSLQQAVDLIPNNSPDKANYLHHLGIAKHHYYKKFSKIVDLEQTIDLCQQVVNLTSDNLPDKALYLDELGEVLTSRYQKLNNLTDLQQAIVIRQQAFDLTSEKSSDEKTTYLCHLATNLYMRHIHTGEVEDLQRSLEYYRQGAKKGNLDCARNWLNLAFSQQIWQEVIEAYGYLSQTNQKLFAVELIRERKETKLREVQGLASKVAYAFLKQGQLSQSVETLEHSSARLLSENLMRTRPNAGLIQKNIFDRVLGQIFHLFKKVGDSYGFDYPSNFLTIVQASRDTPLVYISVTEIGGFALVVQEPEVGFRVPITKISAITRFSSIVSYKLMDKMSCGSLIEPDQAVTPVYLPLLTETVLNEKMVMPKNQQEIAGYFANYILWRETPKSESLYNNWQLALEEITKWLWQAVMQPILEVLPQDCRRITLIPTGHLNLLPLHAAWTKDDNMPTGKRYALDSLTIGYAPNAYSLVESRKIAQRVTANKLLAIDEPKPVKLNPLPSSSVEVNAIAQHFIQPQLLRHDAATQETVKKTLNLNYNVLHFSCHGGANFANPLETGLLMANDETLTVQHFLDAKLQARLATLSACETGMIGTKNIEEVVGLPASLLQAGVAGVVASLWLVSDLSTALLLIRFYENFMNQPNNTARALNEAQNWLRQLTRADAETFFEEKLLPHIEILYRDKPETKKRVEKQWKATLDEGGNYPFESLNHWAAFTATGV